MGSRETGNPVRQLTNGFGRLVSSQPSCRRELGDPIDRRPPPYKVPCLVLTRFIGRGLCSLDIVVRRNGSRSGPLATIDAQFLTGRKGSLRRSSRLRRARNVMVCECV